MSDFEATADWTPADLAAAEQDYAGIRDAVTELLAATHGVIDDDRPDAIAVYDMSRAGMDFTHGQTASLLAAALMRLARLERSGRLLPEVIAVDRSPDGQRTAALSVRREGRVMGWASAGAIFDPVAQALIDLNASDDVKRGVLGPLIDRLTAEDWDTCDESADAFADDPVIVELFGERGWGPGADEDAP